uniref:G-protein coupled receptors family 1 profile domain-containing protein n=1 Tax=Romanomermis culicivorax TaxID=13658 RepID=A0A915HFA1_ROMCU
MSAPSPGMALDAATLVPAKAVFGNGLVIYIIWNNKRLRNVTSYFIVNLAIADALTGLLAVPFKFQAALLQYWPLPSFMCSLVTFIETVSLSVSVLTLTGTAVDRFQTVVLESRHKMTPIVARLTVVGIWVFSVILSVPYGWDHRTTMVNESGLIDILICTPTHGDETWWKVYNVYLTIVQYFVPLIIINGVYTIVAYKVWLTKPVELGDLSRDERVVAFRRNKRRVIKMLLIVVAVFTFCWLPYEIYLVLNEVRPNVNDYYYINVIFFCCHWLAMSNSCLNPIIYGVYNEKFQREYRRIICRICCGRNRPRTKISAVPKSYEETIAMGQNIVHDEDGVEKTYKFNNGYSRRLKKYSSQVNTDTAIVDMVNTCHQYIVAELGKDEDDYDDSF